MKKKIIALVLTLTMISAVAVMATAYAASGTGTGNLAVIDPTGAYGCPSGQEIRLRANAFDFGPFDSTGNLRLRIREGASGTIHIKYWSASIELDGPYYYWYTPYTSSGYMSAEWLNVSTVGVGQLQQTCY